MDENEASKIDKVLNGYKLMEMNNADTTQELVEMLEVIAEQCSGMNQTESLAYYHAHNFYENAKERDENSALKRVIEEHARAFYVLQKQAPDYNSLTLTYEAKYYVEINIILNRLLDKQTEGYVVVEEFDTDRIFTIGELEDRDMAVSLTYKTIELCIDKLNHIETLTQAELNTISNALSCLSYNIMFFYEESSAN